MSQRLRRMDTKAEQALDFWSPLRPPEGVAFPGKVVFFGYYGHCSVVVCDEVHEYGPVRHASIAHPYRYPTWDEIVAVRDRFFGPDTECVMFIPRRADYVNIHPNAFHIWGDPDGRRIWVLAERGTDDERDHTIVLGVGSTVSEAVRHIVEERSAARHHEAKADGGR